MYATDAYLFAKNNTMKCCPGLFPAGAIIAMMTLHAKGRTKDFRLMQILPKTTATVPLSEDRISTGITSYPVSSTLITMTGSIIIFTLYSQRNRLKKKRAAPGTFCIWPKACFSCLMPVYGGTDCYREQNTL